MSCIQLRSECHLIRCLDLPRYLIIRYAKLDKRDDFPKRRQDAADAKASECCDARRKRADDKQKDLERFRFIKS